MYRKFIKNKNIDSTTTTGIYIVFVIPSYAICIIQAIIRGMYHTALLRMAVPLETSLFGTGT